ncbi:MAG: hypothetical protein AB7E51_01210 [Pseudodesulfovibrio sp.]|uniref:hypothetical protein n=1 Tax=Pseudodesulfovibrio sp. TaxID=2035812 RepID=UPI003D10F9A4
MTEPATSNPHPMPVSPLAVRLLILTYFAIKGSVSLVYFLLSLWHGLVGLPFGDENPFWLDMYYIFEPLSFIALSLYACLFILRKKTHVSKKIAGIAAFNILTSLIGIILFWHKHGLDFQYDHPKFCIIQIILCSIILAASIGKRSETTSA